MFWKKWFCKHCWHGDGVGIGIEAIPDDYERICCWCRREEEFRAIYLPIDKHGPHVTKASGKRWQLKPKRRIMQAIYCKTNIRS